MKLLTLSALALCSVSFAQQAPTSITTLIDTHLNTAQVLTQRIGIAHDALTIKGLDIDCRGFGGASFKHGTLTGGLSAGPVKPFSLAKEVHLNPALFGGMQGGKLIGGAMVTLSWDFSHSQSLKFEPMMFRSGTGMSVSWERRF